MDEARVRAYNVLLAQGLLHLKWDLAAFYGGIPLLRPWKLWRANRSIRRAALRTFAFHNLATLSPDNFTGFSEEDFWAGIEEFHRKFPDALCPYREVFERCLNGEPVYLVAPDGVGAAGRTH